MGRRRRRGGPHGVVGVDKPAGPTSFTVMRAVQRALDASRAGHAGTLDPAASGVLVVLLGEATKLSSWLMDHDKEYVARIRLGVSTDTLDLQGTVQETAEVPPAARDPDNIRAALRAMTGEIQQVPPVYSALKRDGRTLMSRARAGEDVQVDPRPVVCHALELLGVEGADLRVHVHCGRGYYVRSLARDLGIALGVPACLAALQRTRVGRFRIEDAASPDAVSPADVRSFRDALEGIPIVELGDDAAAAIRHGRPVAASDPGERALLVDGDGAALAMAERTSDDRWRVARGFSFDA